MENKNDTQRFMWECLDLFTGQGTIGMREDSLAIIYALSYLSIKEAQINNRPYPEWMCDSKENILSSFIDYMRIKFNVINDSIDIRYKKGIDVAFRILDTFNYSRVTISVLQKKLNSHDIYFYEELLKTNIKSNYFPARSYQSTPDEMIEIFKNLSTGGRLLDIGCGMGNTLVNLCDLNYTLDGIEINQLFADVAYLRLDVLTNNDKSFEINVGDFLIQQNDKKYDLITCNMPFGLHINYSKKNEIENNSNDDFMFDWTYKPSMSSDWFFINKLLKRLKQNGKAIVVTTAAALFKNADLIQRKELIESNYIETVIEMPAGTYPGIGISYSIVVLNLNKNNNIVKFIDATECFIKNNGPAKLDVNKIIDILKNDNGKIYNIELDEIRNRDYMLLASKYSNIVIQEELYNATKIKDVSALVMRGYQTTISPEIIDENGEFAIVTISDINDNGRISNNLKRFNINKDLSKYYLQEGDVLISTKGTKIKVCVVEGLPLPKTLFHGNLTMIRVDSKKINPVYLKLFLDSDRGQNELNNIQTGVAIISINTAQLENLNIPLIPIDEQNRIVDDYKFKKMKIDAMEAQLAKMKDELTFSLNDNLKSYKGDV